MALNENAKKWVAALRSGEYNQTTRCLQDDEGFCCLGVATDLFIRETGKGHWNKGYTYDTPGYTAAKYISSSGKEYEVDLAPEVADWLGLSQTNGHFGERGDLSLSSQNDNDETFHEIADLIECNPVGLFKKEEEE